jgi:hypothetical protein
MTETTTLPDGQVAESPHTPRPASDGAARHAIEDATALLKERAMLDNPASKDMPGRQRDIQERQLPMQDWVDKILAKVDPAAAGS